ncbi:hypothetical protein GCM10009612_27150 [Streptomyces beijiangensis]
MPIAISGAIVALVIAAVVIAIVVDADVVNAVRIAGFILIGVAVLLGIITLMRRTKRRQ